MKIPIIALLLPILSGMVGCVNYLASPMHGVVTRNGQPVAEARVMRTIYNHWYAEQIKDMAVTDEAGEFLFEQVVRVSADIRPHQPVTDIDVWVEYEGRKYKALGIKKMNYNRFGETTGHIRAIPNLTKLNDTLILRCELTQLRPAR